MRPFILLIGLFIALFSNLATAQNCISYATSVALVDASVVNANNSLNAPNTTVADLPDDNDYIVWDMGTDLPIGTQICVRVKKPSSGGNFNFKTWSGASGINVSTGSYTQLASYTNLSHTSLTDKCVTLTATAQYIKVTHEDNSDFSIDAVIATCPPQPPNAGPDKSVADLYAAPVTMAATAVTGGKWTAATSNPGLSVIFNENSATTTIGAFNKAGTYKFFWSANGLSDTAIVTVGGCQCDDNKIENSSFELGSGSPSSWTPGGSYTTWQKNSFAAQCGSGNSAQMDGNHASNFGLFYQDETISGGAQIVLKFKAGTHVPAQFAQFGLIFYEDNTKLDSFFLEIDHILGDGTMLGYTITRTAPGDANKVRVIGKVGTDWLKVDLVCLNLTGGCSNTAGTDGSTSVCNSSTSAISLAGLIAGESTGGVWSRASGSNGTFNAGAGTFTPASDATTSTFRYVVTGTGECPNDTSLATVTLTSPPNAGSDGNTTVCNSSTSVITLANLISGEATGGTWSRASGSNGTFNAGAGTFTPASNATTSTFRYVIAGTGGCPNDTSIATVTITGCCDGQITSLFFNRLSGSPDIAITAGGNYPLTTLSNLYNLQASVSGTVQSVKFIITGPSGSTPTTDNSSPYNAPASGTAWVPSAGAYSVKVEAYTADNAGGSLCHDTTITFNITNCTPEAGTDGSLTTCTENPIAIDLFSIIGNESSGGTWSRATGSGGTFNAGAGTFTPAAGATTSTFRYVKTGIAPCPNDTSIATITIVPTCPTTTTCFVGTNDPTVTAKMITTIIGDKVKIWTQLSKTFVDNTYGENAIGWNNHNFKMLYQSDQMQLALYDNNNSKKLEFKMDYLSADESVASGYKSLGVTGGDGVMLTGNASSVVSVYTSMEKNFNEYGYVLTVNSPATDEDFTPNPTYPNWIFEVWYEVVVDAAVFGASGFGKADITGIHASPSKTGDESEPIDEGPCCTGQITSVFFKHLSGGANIPIVDGGDYNLSSFNDLYDLEATTSGSVGSVKFTVGPTGQTGTSNTENSSPYNANWDPQAIGSYTVTVKIYAGANLTGEICDEFTVVFNVVSLGSIGDYVWLDADGDGQQDASEFQLKGIVVTLTKPDASTVKDTTDNNGKYLFTNLVAGTYSVSFAIPSGYMVTTQNSGSDNTDSDINASGLVSGIVLTNGQNNLTIDAGLKVTNCDCPENSTNLISNPGFEDALQAGYWTVSGGSLTTGDGYQMCGQKNAFLDHSSGTARMYREFPVGEGSMVNLNVYAGTHTTGQACSPWLKLIYLNAAGVALKRDSVDIDKDVDVPDFLLKYFSISGVAPAGTSKIRVEITINCDYVKLDGFCLTASPTASLGNFVWHDLNGDGVQDPGEPGINNVAVTLLNGLTNTTITTTATNSAGKYLFTGLAPGTYKVTFGLPSGFTASTANIGADDKDSDAGAGGMTGNYVLVEGQVDTTVDAGYYQTASLGNFVWEDLDGDGIQDLDEPPAFTPATVVLTNVTTGVSSPPVNTVGGFYLFTGLTPGTYKVTFASPSGSTFTSANKEPDSLDSDADSLTGVTGNYILSSGEVNLTVDAGFSAPAAPAPVALGNFVWHDQNANGIQDIGELGIPNVGVTVTNIITEVSQNMTTDANGRYWFDGLDQGTYQVTFATPVGYVPTLSNIGSDAADSDAGVGGVTGNYTLVEGQEDSTVDAGFYSCPGSLPFDPVSVCGTQQVNLTLYEPVGYTGGTWTQNGNPVANPTAVIEGSYVYTKIVSPACTTSGTFVITREVPDYTPRISIVPGTINGPSVVNVLIDVVELNGKSSCDPVYVLIPAFGERYTFTYVPSLTSIGIFPVSNSHWQYMGLFNGAFHVWLYVGSPTFPASGISKFGFTGIYNNQGTSGETRFTVEVVQGSGGEINYLNNSDGKTLFYRRN